MKLGNRKLSPFESEHYLRGLALVCGQLLDDWRHDAAEVVGVDPHTGVPDLVMSAKRHGDAPPTVVVSGAGTIIGHDLVAWMDEDYVKAAWQKARVERGLANA